MTRPADVRRAYSFRSWWLRCAGGGRGAGYVMRYHWAKDIHEARDLAVSMATTMEGIGYRLERVEADEVTPEIKPAHGQ